MGISGKLLFSGKSGAIGNIGLAKNFENVDDLANDATIILKGKVKEGVASNRQLSDKVANEIIYDLEINKIIKNETEIELEEMDLKLVHTTGFEQNGIEYNIAEVHKIGEGNYLLFLNKLEIKNNQVFLVNTTPNHLYLEKGNSFENQINGTKINNITQDKVEKSIRR